MEARRVQYLASLIDVLWPTKPIDSTTSLDNAQPQDEYLVVPNARMPRLLVPARHRVSGAAAVRRYSEPGSTASMFKRQAVALAVRTGLANVVIKDRVVIPRLDAVDGEAPTIEQYLREHLGDIVISVHLGGPARANRKPVLQVLDRRGTTIGFAKVSLNELTRRLIQHESSALRFLSAQRLPGLVTPAVMHHGTWRNREVVVQSALPIWQRRRGGAALARRQAAMLDVATVQGATTAALRDSSYMSRLVTRVSLLKDATAPKLLAACEELVHRRGHTELEFGSWHGDWSPWNMAAREHQLLVWDWERFAHDVPLGFDAVHYRLQELIARQPTSAAEAVERTLETAPADMRLFGVSSDAAELTALLYLIDIAARYTEDGQAAAGARLGVLDQWLLPVLGERVSRL